MHGHREGNYQQLAGHANGARQGRGGAGYARVDANDGYDQEIEPNHHDNYLNSRNDELKRPLLDNQPGAADADHKNEKDSHEDGGSGCWY